jgi:hypothetical protein
MSYYEHAMEKARAQDGNESVRSKHLAATIAYLQGCDLTGTTVEDDGIRVLVHRGQPSRGVPAKKWLADQGAAP